MHPVICEINHTLLAWVLAAPEGTKANLEKSILTIKRNPNLLGTQSTNLDGYDSQTDTNGDSSSTLGAPSTPFAPQSVSDKVIAMPQRTYILVSDLMHNLMEENGL